ncbi:aminoacyl-tRNA hydrolase [Candidatus Berkelbacteria bacterium RIFCSPLOWO2_01_FULL_50_28]|uniref:Peptidyl-tRNA hydrolase n=1 Tax=Candidatus Berkelbacteria bacterium RIFCSPLOWO2_01_FULL_50_28 TaxID=1797471 RepID=A0A1F5EBL7_9BACT|nr:MAG: aminoacyl-tRNA hydrolase [Candidatus Berkelbacteria bacterium RIFCSPHIGHO2_01_FULL_50_36]OGD63221.1 MAG: aminoacyl-tRNA hydrolase [Candidatus Berkelbacteria bacterium RIFCSPHIGHO2_12_FULL_50_11]OGD64807.1 MAG: aminoacyl-tRNA hydrolase [Candidatus Berkelbacteria bacterium RIFCSPLOWO2_01_FULL_50_28]
MIVIVGLGNPGQKYDKSRHNLGFVTIGATTNKLELELKKSKFTSTMYARGDDFELIAPLTYVNESGLAVAKVQQKHGVDINDIWVIHDDTEIPFGEVRVKRGGTSGGHNGIKSIDEAIGTDYWRIRVGVGRPENHEYDLADYVLAEFSAEESKLIPAIVDRVSDFLVQSIHNKELSAQTFNAKNEDK